MLLCSNITFAAQEDESRAGDMDTVMFYPSVEIEEGGHSISALRQSPMYQCPFNSCEFVYC